MWFVNTSHRLMFSRALATSIFMSRAVQSMALLPWRRARVLVLMGMPPPPREYANLLSHRTAQFPSALLHLSPRTLETIHAPGGTPFATMQNLSICSLSIGHFISVQ
ncbi:hypothetical protein CPB83DRAFT_342168 [Crepidotus variabilis]|uniref:Secreted protein n=1 Tax=Crepidotus variabilis TaxID=179855 RepID=A0A9P6ESW1_9AGAR|nr:hypothetical protein CPB83DRAFT_342168 [Crepidotus variabilis]